MECSSKVDLIKKRLLAAQSRQKSYADQKRRTVQFEIGDHVFLKVSPTKGVMRFGRRGKLSPSYIGPFEVLERKGEVAYEITIYRIISSSSSVSCIHALKVCAKFVSCGGVLAFGYSTESNL